MMEKGEYYKKIRLKDIGWVVVAWIHLTWGKNQ
jgi:hypothetical protein